MQKEMVIPFLNKFCKLVLKNGFILYGTIDLADETSILFTTDQKSSILDYSLILELKPIGKGRMHHD